MIELWVSKSIIHRKSDFQNRVKAFLDTTKAEFRVSQEPKLKWQTMKSEVRADKVTDIQIGLDRLN